MTNMAGKWTADEIAELGPLLRQYVQASLRVDTTSEKRRTCACCGEKFRRQRGRPSPFCATCKPEQRALAERNRLALRHHHVIEPRICTGCGQKFQAQRRWAKYCCAACAQRAYRQRHSSVPEIASDFREPSQFLMPPL
jgi:hypothetical protein